MAAQRAGRRGPRLAVVGQFRMVVEAVARTFGGVAQARVIVLDKSVAAPAVRDAVLRERVAVVVLVTDPSDTIDAVDVVTALAASRQRVVVTGERHDGASGSDLLAAGATAYLPDGVEPMRHLIDLVAHRRTPPRSASAPSPDGDPSSERSIRRNLTALSSAEERILWRLMHGESVTDIAREHVVSAETVRTQIRTILVKTESPSRLIAVARAWQVGWSPVATLLDE